MFDKLESVEKRYTELEKLIGDPSVISDKSSYQKYAKELSGLSRIVGRYRDYKKIVEEISGIEKLLVERGHEKEFIELVWEELSFLKEKKVQREKEIEELLTEKDSDKKNNIIIEIRAGTGGAEASLFVADLYRMYSKYSNRMGWKIEIMNTHPTEAGGFKEVIFSLTGDDVYKKFKYESGTHRVQRVPVTEASGRIHTSTVTVAVLPEPEEVEIQIEQKDLKIDVYRSSGPGGQSVNTADSAVRITHIPTCLVVTCQDERSQLKNKLKAMRVLRARLLDSLKSEQQSKISKDRRLQVGTGERSEKIRTYNFPDRRVTDHRVGLTLYNLSEILEGALDEIISALIEADKKMRLAQVK